MCVGWSVCVPQGLQNPYFEHKKIRVRVLPVSACPVVASTSVSIVFCTSSRVRTACRPVTGSHRALVVVSSVVSSRMRSRELRMRGVELTASRNERRGKSSLDGRRRRAGGDRQSS